MIEFRRRGSLCRKRAREMDMDKRIHLELRNRTPSDVSICQKYLRRSVPLLCVCVCVCGAGGTFLEGAHREVGSGGRTARELQRWGWKRRASLCRPPPPPLSLPCVTTCACAPACAVWVREGACECAPRGRRAHAFGSQGMRHNPPELAAPMTLSGGKINERRRKGLPPDSTTKTGAYVS